VSQPIISWPSGWAARSPYRCGPRRSAVATRVQTEPRATDTLSTKIVSYLSNSLHRRSARTRRNRLRCIWSARIAGWNRQPSGRARGESPSRGSGPRRASPAASRASKFRTAWSTRSASTAAGLPMETPVSTPMPRVSFSHSSAVMRSADGSRAGQHGGSCFAMPRSSPIFAGPDAAELAVGLFPWGFALVRGRAELRGVSGVCRRL
jgi:hypothetical protein